MANPACQGAPGCGEWKKPLMANPAYKGKWSPPKIDNPEYSGEWQPRTIPVSAVACRPVDESTFTSRLTLDVSRCSSSLQTNTLVCRSVAFGRFSP